MLKLKYGKRNIQFEPPQSCEYFAPPNEEGASDGKELIKVAIVNSRGFVSEALKSKNSIGVVVPDMTRYSGAEIYAPMLLDIIASANKRASVKFIVANGLHRRPSHSELINMLGGRAAESCEIICNEAESPEKYAEIGRFEEGEPIEILKVALECEALIVTGAVSLHYLAGFGGGRKSIVPGIASRKTILAAHKLSLHPTPGEGRHPECLPANLENNPMHIRLMKAAELVKPIFALNTVVRGDKRIAAVFGGELAKSFYQACEFAKHLYVCKTGGLYDAVIASAGGAPKDIDLIQAHKALEYASRIVKPNGLLFLLAECPDGTGHKDFIGWFAKGSSCEMDIALRANFQVYGQTAVSMRKKTESFKVFMMTSLSDEILREIGAKRFTTIDSAFEIIAAEGALKTAILPEAGTFCHLP